MKYQLVLQWPSSLMKDLDQVIEVEAFLETIVADEGDVDGHDIGSGEVNIFVHTDTPESLFARLAPALASLNRLSGARVAYRDLSGDKYKVLWPKSLVTFSIT